MKEAHGLEVEDAEGWIRDAGEADFEREVLDASAALPVVVDFWAPWCGPCRALAPILEKAIGEHAGAIRLVRVNIDEAPQIAQIFRVTSIPAVTAFRDGHPVAEFLGAQPESEVRAFLERLLPSDADRHAIAGVGAWEAGDAAAAEEAFGAALDLEARHPTARLGMARCCAARDDIDAALSWLEPLLPGDAEAERLAASLRLRRGGEGGDENLAQLEAQIAADPDDHAARVAWAQAQAGRGRHEEALAMLLESIERAPHWQDDAARKVMLDLFATLGDDHDLTQHFRPALARLLFR